jgi:hypothetical protein
MRLDCLNRNQIKVLRKLGFLRKKGFYLAGGTSLALHLCHRSSLDLDFYTQKKFDYKKLRRELEEKFEKIIFLEGSNGTLIMKLDKLR